MASPNRYFLRINTHDRQLIEVSAHEFSALIADGFCILRKPHIAIPHSRFRIWLDAQKRAQIEVRDPAERDQFAIPSWLGVILKRIELYTVAYVAGQPQYDWLWAQHDEVNRR